MSGAKTIRLVNKAGTVIRVAEDQVETLGHGFDVVKPEPKAKPGSSKKSG